MYEVYKIYLFVKRRSGEHKSYFSVYHMHAKKIVIQCNQTQAKAYILCKHQAQSITQGSML